VRTELKQLRSMREKLEAMRPATGIELWAQIFQAQRVAGVPRAVSMAREVILLRDFAADKSVNENLRTVVKAKLKSLKECAAYQETTWLDQKQLKRYLEAYRANGYTGPAGYEWVENREKNPHPYVNKG
jgi:hypothetical protein